MTVGGECIRWYNKGKKYGLEDYVEGVDPWDILPWSKYSDTRNGLERPFLSPTQYLLFCVCLQLVPHPKGQTWNAAAEMRNSTTVTIYIAFFLGSDAVYSGRYLSGNPASSILCCEVFRSGFSKRWV